VRRYRDEAERASARNGQPYEGVVQADERTFPMASNPEIRPDPGPDTIEPQSPPETQPSQTPSEEPMRQPGEIESPQHDTVQPSQQPTEIPAPPD
jgi:hypothetical protein